MGVRCGLLVGNFCEQKWYRGMEIKNSGEFRIYYNIDTFLQDTLFRTASSSLCISYGTVVMGLSAFALSKTSHQEIEVSGQGE
eukprot:scaffold9045_cov78-Skeletonema_dohrnii-CCMP3373.AAC.1